jgi:hypothetical protein
MPISVEDALMRDAIARLEQATHVNPKWLWDGPAQQAVLRATDAYVVAERGLSHESAVVVFVTSLARLTAHITPQAAMAAVEATTNGHTKEKP